MSVSAETPYTSQLAKGNEDSQSITPNGRSYQRHVPPNGNTIGIYYQTIYADRKQQLCGDWEQLWNGGGGSPYTYSLVPAIVT